MVNVTMNPQINPAEFSVSIMAVSEGVKWVMTILLRPLLEVFVPPTSKMYTSVMQIASVLVGIMLAGASAAIYSAPDPQHLTTAIVTGAVGGGMGAFTHDSIVSRAVQTMVRAQQMIPNGGVRKLDQKPAVRADDVARPAGA